MVCDSLSSSCSYRSHEVPVAGDYPIWGCRARGNDPGLIGLKGTHEAGRLVLGSRWQGGGFWWRSQVQYRTEVSLKAFPALHGGGVHGAPDLVGAEGDDGP